MTKTHGLSSAYSGKKVLVTGHTGFKGSWLSLWLSRLGADVYGFSLAPERSPNMFNLCNIEADVDHEVGDIRDAIALKNRLDSVKPDIIFHLAAQALVRPSYDDPIETITTNIIGTANVMEAVRAMSYPCALVVVSSDKCYENREWIWGYRENDPMGGHDPYSMSKGATELLVSSWRESFFRPEGMVKIASARAGNVIGGGDWARDRIIPDCVNAFSQGEVLEIRNPGATRPWQHVLEPLSGYILLASKLLDNDGDEYCSGWNFGPRSEDVKPVSWIVDSMAEKWGSDSLWSAPQRSNPDEAVLLSLNCDKAVGILGWRPTWNLDQALEITSDWYQGWLADENDIRRITLGQIEKFQDDMDIKI